jgi:hypothetical protein
MLAATVTGRAALAREADRVRALAKSVAAHLAYTTNHICPALERLAEESKERSHYTRGEDNL